MNEWQTFATNQVIHQIQYLEWTEKWFLFVHNLKYLKKRFTPEM